ncbi:MAG: hypothetical protein OXF88_00205 [Rhodobacteraceae bacterium]|nr:hypothetical protein [Paracoccaceae bacterium]
MADTAFIRTLEESGLTRPAAEAIAEAFERRRRPRDDPWMLAYAALLTALLVGGFGWTAAQFNALDRKIDSKIDALDSKIDVHSERLTRIETLLSERLPASQ